MFGRACLALPILLPLVVGDCPAGAKPFPSSKAGSGKIDYAGLFEIDYYGTYKVIKYPFVTYVNSSYAPWPASLKGQPVPPMVLYQCGTTRPGASDPGIGTSGALYFEIPIQKATVAWGAPVRFFELLSLTEAIDLIDLTYVAPPCAQLMEYCFPDVHLSANDPNYSTRAAQTDVVFTDSWGTGFGGDAAINVPFEISTDPGSLHRAEWVKFVGAFFNEEDMAEQVFSEIKTEYSALAAIATELRSNETTQYIGVVPKVIWVDFSSWSGASITNAHYQQKFTEDAGGQLVAMPASAPAGCTRSENTDGSSKMTCDGTDDGKMSFKAFLAQADLIIDQYANWPNYSAYNRGGFEEVYSLTAAGVPALEANPQKAFALDRVITDTAGAEGKMGMPWLDLAQSQPQVFLAGLMEALWEDDFHSNCGLTYLRRISSPEHQSDMGHDDCPLFSSDGNHDCSEIHTHLHEVRRCLGNGLTTTTGNEVSSAWASSVWVAIMVTMMAVL